METILTIYKVGMGPSSSHTMGPNNAAKEYKLKFPTADRFECDLHGSLSLTGKGHLTDYAIELELKPITFNWIDDELPFHPNGMKLRAYEGDKLLDESTIYSVGGGKYITEGEVDNAPMPYKLDKFTDIAKYCNEKGINLLDFIFENEDKKEVMDNMMVAWTAMKASIEKGVKTDGVLPGDIGLQRKAKMIYETVFEGESQYSEHERLVNAYAFAVNEENAGGGIVVTAPTCGAAGVVPAVMYHEQQYKGHSDEVICEALAVGALIGTIIRHNATISGAEGGCQAEIGGATSMAAASLAHIRGSSIEVIEQSAEIALEHCLGLTCDPVGGYVQIPCIERNAVSAARAMNAYRLARLTSTDQLITLDDVVQTMLETGNDMKREYRETSLGGLAKLKVGKCEC